MAQSETIIDTLLARAGRNSPKQSITQDTSATPRPETLIPNTPLSAPVFTHRYGQAEKWQDIVLTEAQGKSPVRGDLQPMYGKAGGTLNSLSYQHRLQTGQQQHTGAGGDPPGSGGSHHSHHSNRSSSHDGGDGNHWRPTGPSYPGAPSPPGDPPSGGSNDGSGSRRPAPGGRRQWVRSGQRQPLQPGQAQHYVSTSVSNQPLFVPQISHLPKLPALKSSNFEWKGNTGLLAHFIRRFEHHFSQYGDLAALTFLKTCIPPRYVREVEQFHTLKDALQSLSQWASDSMIHVHKVEQEIRSISQSTSLAQDRQILQTQITKFQHILEINQDFQMTLSSIWPHISKYSEPTAYSTMLSSLNQVAANNQDLGGLKNYVIPFILCLKQQLRFVDEKLTN